jgi:hypothetical protein
MRDYRIAEAISGKTMFLASAYLAGILLLAVERRVFRVVAKGQLAPHAEKFWRYTKQFASGRNDQVQRPNEYASRQLVGIKCSTKNRGGCREED